MKCIDNNAYRLFKRTLLRLVVVSIFIFFHCIWVYSQDDIIVWKDYIKSANLMQTTGYLSSNKFKGRLPGSPEYEVAARYVALRFKESGLKPVDQQSFLHFFDVERNIIENAELLVVLKNDSVVDLELGKDFVCRGFTGSGCFKAPAVFAGYGIITDEYNDYDKTDVKDKIVIAFKGSPNWKPSSGSWGDNSPRAKARIAKKNGALGLVLIPNPSEKPSRDLIGSIACGEPPHLYNFPMIQIARRVFNELLLPMGFTIDSLHKTLLSKKQPVSFEVNKMLSVCISTKYNPKTPTPNVVGIWEGVNPEKKNELIVVGAHLDHVGTQAGSLIFHGANDNASGVAALVEMAHALSAGNIQTQRSILFVVFSGEELGMHGSKHFVENSPVDLKDMIAMLNFDCIAEGDSIAIGGKHSFPELWGISKDLDTKYFNLLSSKTFGGGGADAEAFYKKGIPTLYFNTSGGYNHLHLPSDTVETLNPDLFERLTRLGLATIIELANGDYVGEKDMLK